MGSLKEESYSTVIRLRSAKPGLEKNCLSKDRTFYLVRFPP